MCRKGNIITRLRLAPSRATGRLARLGWALLLGGAVMTGCAAPGRPAPDPADVALFAPLPEPPNLDRRRAQMPLAQIPDDPPAPAPRPGTETLELPRQALRRLEEARQLFAEQRYAEAVNEAARALRYNANIHEAHRLTALACQLSGRREKAKSTARRALELKPDDLACHYVLARLAQKAGDRDQALRKYRLALKCRASQDDAGYRALTHFHLGLLLEQKRYFAAAVEQLQAFESLVDAPGSRVRGNPELATVVRTRRGAAAMKLAHAYGLLGRYAAAADALAAAVTRSPEDWKLRHESVCMLVRAGRSAAAAEAASRFVADSGARPEALALLAAVHRFAGHPSRVVAVLRDIIAEQPENLDLRLFTIDALLAADRHQEAADALDELSARHPGLAEVRWRLIRLSRARHDWRAWLLTMAQELAGRPASAPRSRQEVAQIPGPIARICVDEGLGQETGERSLVPNLADADPAGAALDYLLGRLAERLGRAEDARTLWERAARHRPIFLPAAIALARVYVEHCRWDECRTLIETAAEGVDRQNGPLEALRGRCHDGLDQIDRAIEHYRKAIQIDGSDVHTMTWLARLYERTGKMRSAGQQYEAVLAVDPDNLAVRERLIRTLWPRREQMLSLIDHIEEMQRLDKDAPATQRCRAMVKFLRPPAPDLKGYADRMRQLIDADPEDTRSREELVGTLIALRDYESALREITRLLERNPYSDQANETRSLVLMRLLDFEAAAEQLTHALALYPNRASWIQELAKLRLIEQDYEAAISLWDRLIALRFTQSGEPFDSLSLGYRLKLMQTYRRAERFAEARQAAQGWLAEAPDNDRVRSRLRWFVLAVDAGAGDHDRYLTRVRGWLESEPENRELRGWLLGVRAHYPPGSPGLPPGSAGLIGAKRYDEAVLQVLDWLAEKPEETTFTEWLIAALQAARRPEEAVELAAAHVATAKQTEGRIARLDVLRNAYLRARKYKDVIDTSKDVIAQVRKLLDEVGLERKPLVEALLFQQRRMLGGLLLQAGQADEAVAYLREMIEEVDRVRRHAQTALESLTDRRQQARERYRESASRERQVLLLRLLAFVYQQRGETDQAVARVREAYELLPQDVGLNNDLGYTLADAGLDLAEAERMIRFAVVQNPGGLEAAYLDSLGWVLYKQARFAEARTWLSRATALEAGQDAVIFDHLGDAHWRLGIKDRAVRNWRRSLEIYARKLADGRIDEDEKLVARVTDKLEAAQRGETPEVATMPAETRPAP